MMQLRQAHTASHQDISGGGTAGSRELSGAETEVG